MTSKDLLYIFLASFGLTMTYLFVSRFGVKALYKTEIAICPRCEKEITKQELKNHTCEFCKTKLFKQNLKWKVQ